MAKKVGIMHSGSPATDAGNIQIILDRLKTDCKVLPTYDGPHYASSPGEGTISDIAQRLIDDGVELIIAAGGSRSAEAAIAKRGAAAAPTIVFTSVPVWLRISSRVLTSIRQRESARILRIMMWRG
jgi:hypothetical protein